MTDGSQLRDALRVAVPVEPEEKVALRREALLSVLEREIALTPGRVEKEQSRLKWRRGVRVISAAAALIATLGLGMLVAEFGSDVMEGGDVVASVSGASEPSTDRADGEAHESLTGRTFETRAGHQKVLLLGGRTEVTLAAHTKMYVARDTANEQHVRLSSGGLSLSVPPHQKNRSVEVQTKHATVHVTGTVFGVEVGRFSQPPETSPRTRVTVERGQVVVNHAAGSVTLESGDIWLSPLESGAGAPGTPSKSLASSPAPRRLDEVASSQAPSIAAQPDGARAVPPPAAGVRGPSDGTASTLRSETALRVDSDSEGASTLAAQNDLLERALSAEKRGNDQRARELIERFLTRYPESPLRPSALAVRKRLDETP